MKSGTATIPRLAEDMAVHTLKGLKRRWPTQERSQRRSYHGFQKRLLKRWGDWRELDLLITVAREFGGQLLPPCGFQTPVPYLVDVLTRLHAPRVKCPSKSHAACGGTS